jgi:magnesium chelatase family protein
MGVRLVQSRVRLEQAAEDELGRAYAVGLLSARGRHRVLRVARTIGDLAGRDRLTREDVLLALSLRQRAGSEMGIAA